MVGRNSDYIHVIIIIFAGAHTNGIETQWRHAKKFVKSRCPNGAFDEVKLQEQLHVYMWNLWLGRPYPGGSSLRIIYDISKVYKV